ncbi:hypothetical protein KL933_004594 [Ogataea haglerorum]|uniref:Nuclear envelope protein n=1 Tax=Ogataea haglerorum TaxID=1937702 RepID=A0AAN6D1V9_9ASCO|nr:uncharacterized protein KL911_004530 [Ogataea haglerorum]KAG7693640.1 hypothetical protein KL915_003930 [Ogataea haglerorum]KAG7703358.1 hypothetical protein KL914_004743 [Ogataea haglerorum]KAG7703794.1 hypothetical protein KL950_004591 [Ogataea haglerorum]KAG7724772.1 hypothetical protein KL933_004594 [Ogataea haglerorum]KAG7727835.1 hypothetical protein KL948_004362 [Ogataea haglerorum]
MSTIYTRDRLAGRLGSLPSRRLPSQAQKTSQDALKKQNNYSKILAKVFHMRMKFYSRLALLLAFVYTIVVSLPFRTSPLFFPVKLSLFWCSFMLLKFARDLTLKVETTTYSTLFQQIFGSLLSAEFATLMSSFLISNVLTYGIIWSQTASLSYYIESPTKTIKPFVNDKFLYYWFFAFASTLVYTVFFLTKGKNQLKFKIGVYRVEPLEYLRNLPLSEILKETSIFSISVTLATPVIFLMVRKFMFSTVLFPFIWLLNLNTHLPRVSISLSLYFGLFLLTFTTVLLYEVLNEIYNAYAMVGCLNVKKPLSTHAEDQLETLLSGLKDIKHPFVRLTTFQELVYMAQTAEERKFFYKNTANWTSILEQCSIVIRSVSMAVTADLSLPPVIQTPVQKNSIFGNSGSSRSPIDEDKSDRKADSLFLPAEKPKPKPKPFWETVLDRITSLGKKVRKPELLVRLEKESRSRNTREALEYVLSSLGFLEDLFLPNIEREAAKRVPNKVMVGDAVLVISEVLLHAKHEDRKSVVVPTLTEVLTLLTRLYKATAEFLSDPPARDTGSCCIRELNELTLDYFFKLVVQYNSVLNDLILAPDVFKFAKWCTDTALDEKMEW